MEGWLLGFISEGFYPQGNLTITVCKLNLGRQRKRSYPINEEEKINLRCVNETLIPQKQRLAERTESYEKGILSHGRQSKMFATSSRGRGKHSITFLLFIGFLMKNKRFSSTANHEPSLHIGLQRYYVTEHRYVYQWLAFAAASQLS